jgi:hypothetical protein
MLLLVGIDQALYPIGHHRLPRVDKSTTRSLPARLAGAFVEQTV